MNPWEIIVHAIRNMFRQRKPKPRHPIDGQLGQHPRIALARYVAKPRMPELPPFQFWAVTSITGGFRVERVENTARGPRIVTALTSPMCELSPETIVAMARTIMRATGGKP